MSSPELPYWNKNDVKRIRLDIEEQKKLPYWNNKTVKNKKYQICVDKTNTSFVRDTTHEKELLTLVTNFVTTYSQQINEQFYRYMGKTVHKEIDSSKPQYKIFYKQLIYCTTIQMLSMCNTVKLGIQINSTHSGFTCRSTNIPLHTGNYFRTEQNKFDKYIFIIGFGNDIHYYLKYILFHSRNRGENRVAFFIVCDDDSFSSYFSNSQNSGVIVENSIEQHKYRLFSSQYNSLLEVSGEPIVFNENDDKTVKYNIIDNINHWYSETDVKTLSDLGIFFITGSHTLMKGIGGKRGIIQFYFDKYIYTTVRSHCLTIDDNITCILRLSNNLSKREAQHMYWENVEQLETTHFYTIIEIYDLLLRLKKTHRNALFFGIDKGRSQSNIIDIDNKNTVIKSSAIYKLNLSYPHELLKKNILYSPYFARFFEDMAFNAELRVNNLSIKDDRYYLRYCHTNSIVNKTRSGDEDFNDVLFHKPNSNMNTGIGNVYIVALIYFIAYKQKGYLEFTNDKKLVKKEPLFQLLGNSFSYGKGKYQNYQTIFNVLCMMYLYATNDKMVRVCNGEYGLIRNTRYATDYTNETNYIAGLLQLEIFTKSKDTIIMNNEILSQIDNNVNKNIVMNTNKVIYSFSNGNGIINLIQTEIRDFVTYYKGIQAPPNTFTYYSNKTQYLQIINNNKKNKELHDLEYDFLSDNKIKRKGNTRKTIKIPIKLQEKINANAFIKMSDESISNRSSLDTLSKGKISKQNSSSSIGIGIGKTRKRAIVITDSD